MYCLILDTVGNVVKYWLKTRPYRNIFGMGGGKDVAAQLFFGITLTYQKDTILFITTSVISNI